VLLPRLSCSFVLTSVLTQNLDDDDDDKCCRRGGDTELGGTKHYLRRLDRGLWRR